MSDRVETAGDEPVTGDEPADGASADDADPGEAVPGGAVEGRAEWAHAVLRDVGVVLGVFLVLGLVTGLLWWVLVDPATFTRVDDGGSMTEVELGKRFNGDAWYAVIGAVAGLVSGVWLTWWRSRDFVLTTALLVVGAALAAAVMSVTGHLLGPGDSDTALAAVKAGAQVPVQLEVTAKASYLVWPIAVLVGALVVLWSTPRAPRD